MDRNDLNPHHEPRPDGANGSVPGAAPVANGTLAGRQDVFDRGRPWQAELEVMREQIRRFQGGELPPEKFREFRLANGIYGQRQDGVHMIRVRIPNGALSPAQLEAFAELAENFGHGLVHLTTRQDVQYHYIKLEEVPRVLEILAEVGLHTREACGNSVRNVTSCPFSGVCREEPFGALPYAQAVARFLLRHAAGQMLARKFKIAFSGCASDCAAGAIHDIGAVAVVRSAGATPEIGFRLQIGGGLGSVPFAAQTLTEFVPAAEILVACEAILRIYASRGNRRNRARARLKFVVHQWGIEEFRAEFEQLYAQLAAQRRPDLELERYLEPAELLTLTGGQPSPTPTPPALPPPASPRDGDSPDSRLAYARWLRHNTRPQRQPTLRSVVVNFRLGDMRPGDLRSLASVMRQCRSTEARATIQQNLVLQNIPVTDLPDLFAHLQRTNLADGRAGTALDVLSCPGADTCNLGITTSKGLAEAIAEELDRSDLPTDLLEGASIKISGCPNACGQHHIASIGFHGVARRVHGRQAPFYQIHLGGEINAEGAFLAKGGLKAPARNIPRIVGRLFETFRTHRTGEETMAAFLRRFDQATISQWLDGLLEAPPPGAAPEYYQDFHQSEPFSTDSLGVGECAGAGTDLSSDPFGEVVERIEAAAGFLEHGLGADVLGELRRALYAIARVVLEDAVGKRVPSDYETTCEFRARLVDRGHASELWEVLEQTVTRLSARKETDLSALPHLLEQTRSFLEEGRALRTAVLEAKERGAPVPGLALREEREV